MPGPTLISRILDFIVHRVAAGLKIPEEALRMFRTANALSGLDRKTLPTELIPLNTMQLSRGLLNFTLLQSLDNWVFPYWAERQYDPADPGFIPRSHLGLSINVTRRNWTAVGAPSCSIEPVVDPRGAVMPLRNRWSVEPWLKCGAAAFFPSRSGDVRQRLRNDLPIVTTEFACGAIALEETVFVHAKMLVVELAVTNNDRIERECTVAFAIRPFNGEGACQLGEIRFDARRNAFVLDGGERFSLPGAPDEVHCSNLPGGDSAAFFAGETEGTPSSEAKCDAGLANGYAAFALTIAPGDSRTFRGTMCLEGVEQRAGDVRLAEASWTSLLGAGTEITTPDTKVNSLVRASVSTLLMLADGDSITPGPWTYHQFWFRDAAVMLRALDAFGHHGLAREVIVSFPSRQEASGYFRSQQGEWDSNGQALWTVWQHALLAQDAGCDSRMTEALAKGAEWILRKRQEGGGRPALMPAGLSAEHLGLSDRYFWDNWWSAAGLEGYARLCVLAGNFGEAERIRREAEVYKEEIEDAIVAVQDSRRIDVIPAGPSRGIDCGMIGSCAPWYPLQILPPGDARMRRTLEMLMQRYGLGGLFFQNFIHSGVNPYLTLQIAQAWLYGGDRTRFWKMFSDVALRASPTLNFPEAIHPLTGGGTMGDGHHGWAAAEVALSLRSVFVSEVWTPDKELPELVLLGGIPPEWLAPGKRFEIRSAPVPGGILSLQGKTTGEAVHIEIDHRKRSGAGGADRWRLVLPAVGSRITVNGRAAPSVAISREETAIMLLPSAGRTVVSLELQGETVGTLPYVANR